MAHCEPAASLIKRLGGPSKLAAGISVPVHTVQRWQRETARGGTGGAIPRWQIEKVTAFARTLGVELTAADFVPMGAAAE